MSTSLSLEDEKICLHSSQSDYLIGNGVRQRGNTMDCEETPRYFIRPFKEGAATMSSFQTFIKEVTWLFHQREAQQTLFLVSINLMTTLLLLSWCHTTRSMALMAYTYLSWFSLLSLITCLVCVWAEGQQASPTFTYGYLRYEALAVFSSVILSLLGAVIIVKECIERLLEPETVHTGMLSVGGILGLVLHLGMTTLAHNPPLTQVLRASQSSLLQEHVADMCQSLCNYVPALTRILLPRVDPVVLISIAGFLAILIDHLILQMYNYQAADSVAALVIAILTITTMFPLCVCSASILLQVFKDDWTRSSTTLQLLNDSARALATSPTHSPHYVNVTYPQVYASNKAPVGNSFFQPQAYYPSHPQTPFSLSVAQGQVDVNLPSQPSSIPGTLVNLTDGINRSFLDNRISFSNNQNQVEEVFSTSDPVLYEKLYSEGCRNSIGWLTGKNTITLQGWTPENKHKHKTSPYYVNVDFSSRSNVLCDSIVVVSENRFNSNVNHSPR
ncbi:zinc transporter 6-like isoform X2 [Cherax quadricarinatus]|uniref:zinc transporter 6-like isoform X2 n=1 Tax=Cherax quadricarinatus TaxID=27406 RepID=UPI00387ED2B7